MASFTTQEAQQLFSQYTSEELQSMLGKAKFTELSSKLKETKPAKQEAPVVQSFREGGEVMPLPLSGTSLPKPRSYGELFTDIDSTVRGMGKGVLSVGLGLPGDLLALLGGAGSFIGIPGESFFRPEEERGFLPRLKRAAGTVDKISSGVGSLAFEEAAINRLLENEAGLSDRDLALQLEALKTGAFTGPLTPAALGLKAAPKLVSTLDKIEEAVDVVKTKPISEISYNPEEKRILESEGSTGGFLRELFADDDTYVVDTFENFGIADVDIDDPAKLPKGDALKFREKIYNQTQESLKDQPETMLVYRHGKTDLPVNQGYPISFTLAPFRGQLPSQGYKKNAKGEFLKEDDFEVYEVDKKDILANFEGVVPRYASSGAGGERELLIFSDKVKPYQPSFDDDVVQGVGSLDPVKEAAQLAREEKRQKKKARQEAAAFVPNEAKNTAASDYVSNELTNILAGAPTSQVAPVRLLEMDELLKKMRYNFKSGRLLFNPDSGLGMSQADKPRNSKSVLKSFDRLGVTKNELKQTGLLDYLNANNEVKLSDLQEVFDTNKPDFKMVRLDEEPGATEYSNVQRLTQNPGDTNVDVGYETVDVMTHAYFDEGQPRIRNDVVADPHFTSARVPVGDYSDEYNTDLIDLPNSMFHTRGSTILFDQGTDLQVKFPRGVQVIEELQMDYLKESKRIKNAADPKERAKIEANIRLAQDNVRDNSKEVMNIFKDDFVMNEIGAELIGFGRSDDFMAREAADLGLTVDEYKAGLARAKLAGRFSGDLVGRPINYAARGAKQDSDGQFILLKDSIKEGMEFNGQALLDLADEIDGLTDVEKSQFSAVFQSLDTNKMRVMGEQIIQHGREANALKTIDELKKVKTLDPSINTKIDELVPEYREKTKALNREIAELEQSVNNYNKITMDDTLRNEGKIDAINERIKYIEENVPAGSNETIPYLPRGNFDPGDQISLSREQILDKYADDRTFYENQLKETRKRGDLDNPEASALRDKLGKKQKELADYDSQFRQDNPEITYFLDEDNFGRTREVTPDSVFQDQTTTAMYMIKQEIALAVQKGLDGIVLPNYQDIASLRGKNPELFKQTYDDAPRNVQKELEKFGFEVGSIEIPFDGGTKNFPDMSPKYKSLYIKFPEGLDNFEPEVKLAKGGLVRKQVV